MNTFERLLEFDHAAKREGGKHSHRRDIYARIEAEKGRHFIGIAGPRGAGKTVVLKQWAATHKDSFYLSADTMDSGADIFEVAKTLSEKLGFKTLLLDEAHFNHDAPGALKRIFDFLEMRVLFTSSVALAIQSWEHDLSRRVRLFRLGTLSFREYLKLNGNAGANIPDNLSIEDIAEGKWTPGHLRAGTHFDDYLKGGLLPFSQSEPEPLPLLKNILEKVIGQDIPSIAKPLVEELSIIRKLFDFIGRSAVDDINYSSLSRNLGITKYKAEQYTSWLEKAFVLKRVMPAGTNVLKEPKILLAPPYRLLCKPYDEALGGLREDFFVETMANAGHDVSYLKGKRGEKTPDYLLELPSGRLIFEIGGKRKGREQFKGIKDGKPLVLAHTLLPEGGRIPLHLLGFVA
jgi:uncharacterized protein